VHGAFLFFWLFCRAGRLYLGGPRGGAPNGQANEASAYLIQVCRVPPRPSPAGVGAPAARRSAKRRRVARQCALGGGGAPVSHPPPVGVSLLGGEPRRPWPHGPHECTHRHRWLFWPADRVGVGGPPQLSRAWRTLLVWRARNSGPSRPWCTCHSGPRVAPHIAPRPSVAAPYTAPHGPHHHTAGHRRHVCAGSHDRDGGAPMDLSRLLSDDRDGRRGDGTGTPPRPYAVSAPLCFPPSLASSPVAPPPRASPAPQSPAQGTCSPPRASVPRPLPVTRGFGAVAGEWGPPSGGNRPLGSPSPGLSDGDRHPLGMAVTPPGTAGMPVEHEPPLPSIRQLGIGSKPHSSLSRPGSVWTPSMTRAADATAATDAALVPAAYTSPQAIRAAAACRRRAATAGTLTRGAPSPPWPPPQGGGALSPPVDGGGRVLLPPTGSVVVPHSRHPSEPMRATVAAGCSERQGASLPGFAALTSTLGVAGAGAHTAGAPAGFAVAGSGGARGATAADSAAVWPRPAHFDGLIVVGGGGLVQAAQPPAAPSVQGWGWGAPHGAAAAANWRDAGGAAAATHGHRSWQSDEAPTGSHRRWAAASLRGSRSANDLPKRPWMNAAIDKWRRQAAHMPHLWAGGGRGSGTRAGGASVKPFWCTECGSRFGQKGSLHRHINAVHLQLRPHECQTCGKSAFRSALTFWGRWRGGDGGPRWGWSGALAQCYCARAHVLDPLRGRAGLELTYLSMRFGGACCVSFVR